MNSALLASAVVAATLGASQRTAAESPAALLRGRVQALCSEQAWLRERATWLAGDLRRRRMLLEIASAGEERIEELEAIYAARRMRLRTRLERIEAEIEATQARAAAYECTGRGEWETRGGGTPRSGKRGAATRSVGTKPEEIEATRVRIEVYERPHH